MNYAFIAAHQNEFPVIRMCQVLNVSESGYYAWRKREPSQRKREDESLGKRIEMHIMTIAKSMGAHVFMRN